MLIRGIQRSSRYNSKMNEHLEKRHCLCCRIVM